MTLSSYISIKKEKKGKKEQLKAPGDLLDWKVRTTQIFMWRGTCMLRCVFMYVTSVSYAQMPGVGFCFLST